MIARAAIAALAAGAGFDHQAFAGTRRHDVLDSDYTARAALSQFQAAGRLTFGTSSASGTVIGSRWVLTAAHVVDTDLDGLVSDEAPGSFTFTVGAQTRTGTGLFNFPGWDPANRANDLALIKLNAPIFNSGGFAAAEVYSGSDEIDATVTGVGFGLTGTGQTGAQEGTGGTRRAGDNIVDQYLTFSGGTPTFTSVDGPDRTALVWDFDDPASVAPNFFPGSAALALEYSSAPGDSGGPHFLQSGGNWFVAGVTSGGDDTFDYPDAPPPDLATYGDVVIVTRVSRFAAAMQDLMTCKWNNASGGAFTSSANWAGSEGPNSSDVATFDLDATYIVTFPATPANRNVIVRAGNVTLDLNGFTYFQTSKSGNGSLIVARSSGDIAALTVQDGTLDSTDAFIGRDSGSSGTLTVTGPSTEWEVDNAYIGGAAAGAGGAGALTIANGAVMDVRQSLTIWQGSSVNLSGTSGTFSFVAPISLYSFSSSLLIGSGTGTLNIHGALTTADARIGYNTAHNGTVTVSGNAANWSNSNDLYVGRAGTGTANLLAGGDLTTDRTFVAVNPNSHGTVNVTDSGSLWTNNVFLAVGYQGSGQVHVSGGGDVSVGGETRIGQLAGSTGAVTISDSGSTWTNTSDLFVADAGQGTLNVSADADISNAAGYVGFAADSVGTVTVNGAGSTWTNNSQLQVGRAGAGTLNVEAGGVVSNTAGFIGVLPGSGVGAVTVSGNGSTWTNSLTLRVGDGDEGTLDIQNGGDVSDTSGYVGFAAGSTGTVTVSGAGSTWTSSAGMAVGFGGSGELTIESGGNVAAEFSIIGEEATGTGTAVVSGAGSAWTQTGSLQVGRSGSGDLTVQDGGQVSNASAYIGNLAGSVGTVTVTGSGSTWTNNADLHVGYEGEGGLTVAAGGEVAVTGTTFIAANDPDSLFNSVTVTGSGSTLSVGGQLQVGRVGGGSLNILAGGSVTSHDTFLGLFLNSGGGVNVSGAGSTWDCLGNLFVGGTDAVAGGVGSVSVASGGTVSVNGPVFRVYPSGSISLGAGGTLNAGTLVNRGQFFFSGGTLNAGAIQLESGGVMTVSAGAGRVVRLNALTIDETSKLNLNDNKLIVQGGNAGTASGGTYDGLQGDVQRAYNFGSWNGAGLTTAMQGALDGITTIGVATGEQIRGLGPTDTDVWADQTINGASVIAMYTYAGDANLDGQVDAGDYGILDAFIQIEGSNGYGNGDFNYDGFIDAADYGTIDNSIQFQGAPFPTSATSAALSEVSAVPEPAAACGFAGLTASILLRRRRRPMGRRDRGSNE